MKAVCITPFIAVLLSLSSAYSTVYDEPFTFECPAGEIIESIESEHDNGRQDRVFEFSCTEAPYGVTLSDCTWTGYVNDWDEPMVFQCEGDDVITGIYSYHDNGPEDRRYKFECCAPDGLVAHKCFYIEANDWDEYFYVKVEDGHGLKGVVSIHDNDKEDRLFWFEVCELTDYGTSVGVIG